MGQAVEFLDNSQIKKFKRSTVESFTFACKGRDCNRRFKIADGQQENTSLLPQGFYCPSCRLEFCLDPKCNQEYHAPSPCSTLERWEKTKIKFKKTNKDELANIEYMLENTKPCPKCNATTQKVDGCNKIRCRNCNHEWCWLCSKPCPNYKHEGPCLQGLTDKKAWLWSTKSNKRSPDDKERKFLDELKRMNEFYDRIGEYHNSLKFEQKTLRIFKTFLLDRQKELIGDSILTSGLR